MKSSIYKSAAITLAFVVICLATADQAFAQTQEIKEIKNNIPKAEGIIKERCGDATVKVEVDFESFGNTADALSNVPYQGLEEIAYGLGRFCTDSDNTSKTDPVNVGRIQKIDKIVIKFVKDPKDKNVSVQGDMIVISEAFGIGYGTYGQAEIAMELRGAFDKKKKK